MSFFLIREFVCTICETFHFFPFRLLGLDLVPRAEDTYEQVDVDKESTIDLYNIHNQSAQNIEEASVSCGVKISLHCKMYDLINLVLN